MQGCKRCSVAQGLLLKDKWALVTAVAEAFAGEGASVILHAHPLNTDGLGKVRPVGRGRRAQRLKDSVFSISDHALRGAA